jgi:hypothetical protein
MMNAKHREYFPVCAAAVLDLVEETLRPYGGDLTDVVIKLSPVVVVGRAFYSRVDPALRVVAAAALIDLENMGRVQRSGEWASKARPDRGGPYFQVTQHTREGA